MSISDQDLREQFGLDPTLFSFMAEHPELFTPTGRSMEVRLPSAEERASGMTEYKASFMATLGDTTQPATAALRSARLTRLSEIQQETREGKKYLMISGVMRPVVMDIRLYPPSHEDEGISLPEFLRALVNASRKDNPVSAERFLSTCAGFGLDFRGGMPLIWQHFGASKEGVDKAFEWFEDQGAIDVRRSMVNPGRITRAIEFTDGVEVTGFEVGRMDRSMSTRGQGFIDVVEAVVTNFQRVIVQRKAIRDLSVKLETLKGEKKPKEDDIRDIQMQIDSLATAARAWAGNWGGAQNRKETASDSVSLIETNIWDAVSVPVGRITAQNASGEEFKMNFWQRNQQVAPIEEGAVPSGVVTSENVAATDEEPF